MKSIKKKRSMASHRKLHFQKVLGSMIVALALLFAGSAGAQETKTIKGMVRDVTGEPGSCEQSKDFFSGSSLRSSGKSADRGTDCER